MAQSRTPGEAIADQTLSAKPTVFPLKDIVKHFLLSRRPDLFSQETLNKNHTVLKHIDLTPEEIERKKKLNRVVRKIHF